MKKKKTEIVNVCVCSIFKIRLWLYDMLHDRRRVKVAIIIGRTPKKGVKHLPLAFPF